MAARSVFGGRTAQFTTNGIHPRMLMPGTFIQANVSQHDPVLGPGSYEVDTGFFSRKEMERKEAGPNWKRAYQVQQDAKIPHLLYRQQWQEKKTMPTKLGPGSYEISGEDEKCKKPRSMNGIIFTGAERFKENLKNITPGPGTYGEGGIPQAEKEKKERKSTSTVGMLNAKTGYSRALPKIGSELGPGVYDIKPLFGDIVDKVVSVRGPYDLFTPSRHQTSVPSWKKLGPGQYNYKTTLDAMDDRNTKKKGTFSKLSQYPFPPTERIYVTSQTQWPKPAELPGPGQYEVATTIKRTECQGTNEAPFHSTSKRDDRRSLKFFTGNYNPVGPGRYDVQKLEDSKYVNPHVSVFRSKTNRVMNQEEEKAWRERCRVKDVPESQRQRLVD